MKMLRRVLFLFFLLIITVGCQMQENFKLIEVGRQKLKVEIADSITEQAKGLGGRTELKENEGMLFIYPDYRRPSFWMKDMNFPLDIIWIKDGNVVDITPNVPVATSTPLLHYQPQQDINMVLEVSADWCKNQGIKIGDKVKF